MPPAAKAEELSFVTENYVWTLLERLNQNYFTLHNEFALFLG
jgi:hypothetical protein